jgi:hypothetical protein
MSTRHLSLSEGDSEGTWLGSRGVACGLGAFSVLLNV